MMKSVPIIHFSDVLCVWAYIGQLRMDEVHTKFADKVSIEVRFCSVFGDTARKMQTAWGTKGGYQGFNAHLRHSVAAFPELPFNPDLWLSVRPASSTSPHLFLKAAQLAEKQGAIAPGEADRLVRAIRTAFFVQARDISEMDVQREVATAAGIPLAPLESVIRNGQAFAALSSDYQDAAAMDIKGSPSFVMNEGRQKFYGNVGYKIMEANIQELLREPNPDHASWC
jgi:predicted DsbA family dithiol-disulfide isomerase